MHTYIHTCTTYIHTCPSDSGFATVSDDGSIKLWDLELARVQEKIPGAACAIGGTAWVHWTTKSAGSGSKSGARVVTGIAVGQALV